MQLIVYPTPQVFKISKQHVALENRCYIKLFDQHSDHLTNAISRFTDQLNQYFGGAPLSLSYGKVKNEETLISIKLAGSARNRERYTITSSDSGYLLTAGTEEAIFRGLSTLSQIIEQLDTLAPMITVSDEPDIKERGVMLDISRCKVPTMASLKQLIDQFALLKYNQLQIYTEHTFAFSNHPLVWADASPYTAQDILEIKSYCNDRYIQLVPNLNCFGHFERWLRYPEYKKYAECPDGFIHPFSGKKIDIGSTLKPNKQSLKLIDELHAEYLPLFDSEYFNVGGDEPWELGNGWSKELCDEQGTSNVYVDFMSDIKKLSDKRGRKMMFWSDIVLKEPSSLKRLSKDLIAMNWGYEADHPFAKECRQVSEQKLPFYVCPGTSSWNSLTGRTTNMKANLASAAKNAIKFGADGYLMTDWGDYGHHQYLPISYPGFALGACQSWNHKASKQIDLSDLVNTIFFQEADAATANIIIKMGEVMDTAPSPLFNGTIFSRLLFWNMNNETKATADIPSSQLQACADQFEELKSQLSDITAAERSLLQQELGNAMDMACHGISRVLYARGEVESRAKSRSELRLGLQKIIGQHDKNWLARNRPGGLAESRAYLERALSAI